MEPRGPDPKRVRLQPASSSSSSSSSNSSSSSSSSFPAPPPQPPARTPEQQLEHEDRLFKVLGLVGGLGFWEAWRLPQVCRELRFGFCGGGAPADMIKLGLEKRGVWAKLREARAAWRDEEDDTRLIIACGDDDEDVQRVCELIELGWPGSVNPQKGGRLTPLMRASTRGHAGIVKALLAAGADVDAVNYAFGETALIYACYYGRLESARLLVAAKALVNVRDKEGFTPLNCSRGFNNATADPAIEALLLAAGESDSGDLERDDDEFWQWMYQSQLWHR